MVFFGGIWHEQPSNVYKCVQKKVYRPYTKTWFHSSTLLST